MIRAATGDAETVAEPSAAESWAREHGPFVWRILRHLGVRGEDVADVAQEVFLVAYRRRADLRADASVRSWLYGIAANHAMHWRRTRARRREDLVDAPDERPAPEAIDRLEQRDAARIARWILDQLDDAKREVFVLYEYEGLTMKEITEAIGVPLQTGYSRLRLARDQVRAAHAEAKERGWLP